MHVSKRSMLLAMSGALAAPRLMRPALAQGRFPSRPIRVIVPFAPGQANDIFARLVADKLSELRWRDARLVVENRAGAGGTIGMQVAAQAQPDGYTLAFGSLATFAINPALMRNLPYDVERDFTAITRVFQGGLILLVPARGPDADLAALIRRAQAGNLTYASSGPGSTQHLGTELFLQGIGARATHVPYRGSGPALTDLAAGAVDFAFESTASALPLVGSGLLRPLAVSTTERLPQLPNVPTVAEGASLPGYSAYGTGGFLAPARTPAAVIEALHEGFSTVMNDPGVRTRFTEIGTTPMAEGPEPFGAFIRAELAKWREVGRRAGFSLE